MKRNLSDSLMEWKQRGLRKPYLLSGMRGCGKTFLALEFARNCYEGVLYLNFEQASARRDILLELLSMAGQQAGMAAVPQGGRNESDKAATLGGVLSAVFEIPEEFLPNFLMILDEFPVSGDTFPWFLSVLQEEYPFSLLLISSHALPQEIVFPRYEIHHLFPFQFDEFLCAVGSEWYAEVVRGHYQTNRKIPSMVHNELLELFEDYLTTGGMPSTILEYLQFRTTDNIFEQHQVLLGRLLYDIAQYHGAQDALKMRQVLDVVPAQLLKENQKFQYRQIRKGATFSIYRQALEQLISDNILLCCHKWDDTEKNTGQTGQRNCKESNLGFKLYPAGLSLYYALSGNFTADARNKVLLDCYVMQTFNANGYRPFFWESGSKAKVDFLIGTDDGMIPVEVKPEDGARTKSLSIYRQGHDVPYSIRISRHNFEFTNDMKQIPYYAVFCI